MLQTAGRLGHARIAILTAIPEETEAVRKACQIDLHLKKSYFCRASDDRLYPDVVHREVGRSTVVVCERTKEVIEHWQPELIVFCGIAGGISGREDVAYGDIVIPEYVHYCSFAKLSEGGRQLRYIPYDHPSIKLHEDYAAPLRYVPWSVADIPEGLAPPKVLTNGLVGGDKVYGDPTSEEQQAIMEYFDDAVAFDMESVGLCRAVASSRSNPLYNPRLLIVRSISDMADSHNNNSERRRWKEYACTTASRFLAYLIETILDSEPDPRPGKKVSA